MAPCVGGTLGWPAFSSDFPEEDVEAGQVDEAEEILDVIFPSGNKAAEIVHPCKEPLHFPAFSISAQPAAILSSVFASTPVRSNQFDPVLVLELRVERVRVVRLVANEPCREFVKKASGKNLFNKLLVSTLAVAGMTTRTSAPRVTSI